MEATRTRASGAIPFFLIINDLSIHKKVIKIERVNNVKILRFTNYIIKDYLEYWRLCREGKKPFKQYGLRLYTGAQGAGKSVSMVKQAREYRQEYPDLLIVANFQLDVSDYKMSSFEDIAKLPKIAREKGYTGLLICWDELQNDFDNSVRTFPVTILRTITQQRKQGIQILATSQVFTRVAKAIREQTHEVVKCKTAMGRWTFERCYYADEFEMSIQNPEKVRKLPTRWKSNFVQSNELRESFDTFEVIDNLENIVRNEKEMFDSIPVAPILRETDGFDYVEKSI